MPRNQKSFQATEQTDRKWVIVDVENQVLGRAASKIAMLLRGKHRPTFTTFVDNGDFVVVLNASKVKLTGNKWEDKKYYHHTGYLGGIKERSAEEVKAKKPEELIELAVRGMLPKNRLSRDLLTKLRIYPNAEHPHVAQQPTTITF